MLLVDSPPEESADFAAAMRRNGLDPIFLLAPTSTDARFRRIAEIASGYVYYVSLKGVTGAGHIDTDEVARQVPKIQKATGLPVGVGFGIKDSATAARVASFADAVVIGSRLIEVIEEGKAGQRAGPRRHLAEDHPVRDGRRAPRAGAGPLNNDSRDGIR